MRFLEPWESLVLDRPKTVKTRYLCQTRLQLGESQVLCRRPEEYRARDNRAKHAHLCGECWAVLSDARRAEYISMEVVNRLEREGPNWCKSCRALGDERRRVVQDGKCVECGAPWGGHEDVEERMEERCRDSR